MSAAKKLNPDSEPLEAVHADVSHDQDDHDPFASGHGKKVEEGEGVWLISYADMMTLLMGFFALIASFSKVDSAEFEKVKKEAVKYFGGEYKAPYGDLADQLKKVINKMGLSEKVTVEQGPDGVGLTFQGTLLFDSGSFQVKEDSHGMMQTIADAVHKEAGDHNVLIEGHTDNVPISHPYIASNWELSGLRAARVARLFEDAGFQKTQLTIVGWGETKPVVPNMNSDSSPNVANQSKNRRVHIKIYKELPK